MKGLNSSNIWEQYYKSEFYSRRNEEEIEVRKCLLSCGTDSFCPSLLSKYMKIKIFRTIILSEVLCGLETWSLMWQEEHRLRVFENRVLRRIFGLERDEITGEWRRLHIEELYDPYSSLNIIWVRKSMRKR